jgi:hypothetical protein
MQENLTDENFLIQCAKHYKNKQCQSTEEFLSDLKRIKYIKKLISRFLTNNTIDERLVLNHIIILNNVFGPVFLCRILFLKMLPQIEILKPFLLYLNLLPEEIFEINGKNYKTVEFGMNWTIVEKLREIEKGSRKD